MDDPKEVARKIVSNCGAQLGESPDILSFNRALLESEIASALTRREREVDAALAELREMFPDNEITIDFAMRPDGWQQVSIFRFAPPNLGDTILVAQGATLTEALISAKAQAGKKEKG